MSEAYRDKFYPICQRLADAAIDIAGHCTLTVSERGLINPKVLALALLCRTLHNFKGVVMLTRDKLVVEARVLARCCYENMYMVGGLAKGGEAFAERMLVDDRAGKNKRLKFTFE